VVEDRAWISFALASRAFIFVEQSAEHLFFSGFTLALVYQTTQRAEIPDHPASALHLYIASTTTFSSGLRNF
jgi:hypothetical protein